MIAPCAQCSKPVKFDGRVNRHLRPTCSRDCSDAERLANGWFRCKDCQKVVVDAAKPTADEDSGRCYPCWCKAMDLERETLLARVSDVLTRSAIEDAPKLIATMERRIR